MSQAGVSGRPILAKMAVVAINELPDGLVQYGLHFTFTEPYVNGGEWDHEAVASTTNIISYQSTDSEIIASNKDAGAAWISDRYGDPSFTAGDIRGGDVI